MAAKYQNGKQQARRRQSLTKRKVRAYRLAPDCTVEGNSSAYSPLETPYCHRARKRRMLCGFADPNRGTAFQAVNKGRMPVPQTWATPV